MLLYHWISWPTLPRFSQGWIKLPRKSGTLSAMGARSPFQHVQVNPQLHHWHSISLLGSNPRQSSSILIAPRAPPPGRQIGCSSITEMELEPGILIVQHWFEHPGRPRWAARIGWQTQPQSCPRSCSNTPVRNRGPGSTSGFGQCC